MQIELEKNATFKQIKQFHNLNQSEITKLEDFVILVLQKNLDYNFIGKSTVSDIWERHVLDCAQLLKFVDDKNLKFADLGSGCGLPGIILSILGIKEIHLVEKSYRKSEFLRQAKHLSSNRIFVHQAKLEEISDLKFDCITSRALAALPQLLEYTKTFLKEDGYCLFLKGKKLDEEILEAKQQFYFDFEKFPSITSKESNIIKVTNIKKL